MARTKNRFNAISNSDSKQKKESTKQWRVGLYARLSVDSSVTGSDSITGQLSIMHRYIKEHPEMSETYEYADDGYSGTNFSRPSFEHMMEDIRAGKINVVMVKDMSRLGRDYLETSNLIETIFPFLGVRFISVNDHFDTLLDYNGNKDLEIAIKNLVNDMYAKDVSKRVYTSRSQDRLRGKATNVDAPYGYKVNKNHPLRRYEIDEEAAAIVREIFEMVLNGMSYRQIIKSLQDRRISIPSLYKRTGSLYLREEDEQKQWYKGTISAILNNQAYIGHLVQGKRRTRLYEGENQRFTDKEEWIITENAHESIVSVEVFEAVQEIINRKKDESPFSSQRLKSIPIKPNKYKGLLICGHCGRSLRYFSFSHRGEVNRLYAFSCERTDGERSTCSVYIRESVLDGLVMRSIGEVIDEFNQTDELDGLFETSMNHSLRKYKSEEHKLTGSINKELQLQVDAYEGYVLGKISRESYSSQKEKSEEKCLQTQQKLDELELSREKYLAEMDAKKQWILNLKKGSEGELNQDLLQILIKEIRIYSKQRIEINYRFNKKDFIGVNHNE